MKQRKKVFCNIIHTVCCHGNVAHLDPGALEAQRVKYEEQLAKLKEQLESNITSPAPAPKYKITT